MRTQKSMQVVVPLLFVFACVVGVCVGICPSADSTLTKWSTVSGWMSTNAAVTIAANQKILLDVSPPQLSYINVYGALYVNNANINVLVKYISVYEGGSLIVGAEDCPITNKVTFTFYGERVASTVSDMGMDTFDQQNLGSKGLSVRTNGTFMVFGYWSGPSWTNLAQTAFAGQATLKLRESVKWVAGDWIVVASTDFSETIKNLPSTTSAQWQKGNGDPDQTEMVQIQSVSGNIITLTKPLNYTHWGGHYQYAEVGLLTRRVVFKGDDTNSPLYEFGGHVIMRKAKQIKIFGAEFTQMGQKGLIGRYPIHFHFIHDAQTLNYTVQQCSTHHNYQRGITVHETHGVLVKDMVGYAVNGHMYFLEDGGEHDNTFDHNLGLTAYPVPDEEVRYGINTQVIPSDTDVSIFWITNPDNIFTNNAAVGAKFGFWFNLPEKPNGLTAIKGIYTNYRVNNLPLRGFINNTAHSSADTGMMFEHGQDPDGTTNGNHYWGNDGNMSVFKKSTIYKCRNTGVWSITDLSHTEYTIVDCDRHVFYNGMCVFANSTFVGQSANTGITGRNLNATCGITTYDVGTPAQMFGNTFINFTGNSGNSRAGGQCGQGSALHPTTKMFKNTFINAVPVSNRYINVGKGAFVFNDVDGTSTGVRGGAYVISNNHTLALPAPSAGCVYNYSFPGYVCPLHHNGYFQLQLIDQTLIRMYDKYSLTLWNGTVVTQANAVRHVLADMSNYTLFGRIYAAGDGNACFPGSPDACESVMYNLSPRRFVNVKWTFNSDFRASPRSYRLGGDSMSPGDWIYVSLSYPTTATFWVRSDKGVNLTRVSSLSAVDTTTYYYDSNTELLWVLLKAGVSYTPKNVLGVQWVWVNSPEVIIDATCPNNLCQPTLSKLATNYAAPTTLPFVENVYTGTFQNCQVTPSTTATTGYGSVKVWYYPRWNEIHFSILHDLSATVTKVAFGIGGPRQTAKILSTFIVPTGASRAGFPATFVLMSALYNGTLFVQIYSSQFPNGHMRAQLYCQGSCVQPVITKEKTPCQPSSSAYYVFNNGALTSGWRWAVYNLGKEYYNTTNTGLCGSQSITVTVANGEFQVQSPSNFVVTAEYKYLEFYVKTAPGNGIINPKVWFRTSSPSIFATPPAYFADYAVDEQIDEDSGYQLVSIPLTQFGLTAPFTFNGVGLMFGNGQSKAVTFQLDQIRFTQTPATTYNMGATLTAGVKTTIC